MRLGGKISLKKKTKRVLMENDDLIQMFGHDEWTI